MSAASIESQDVDCTPLLCKLKPAITAACAAYGNGASLGTGSVTVTADNTSTNVAVAWNADSRVATFAWRGTQETEVGSSPSFHGDRDACILSMRPVSTSSYRTL